MDLKYIILGVIFVLAAVIVSTLLPRILLLSLRKKLVDPIDERKVHTTTASRLGGLSFFPAIFISIFTTLALFDLCVEIDLKSPNFIFLEFSSLMMLYMIGLYDDLIGLPYRAKFMVQIITALLLVLAGCYIKYFYGVDVVFDMPMLLGIPLTLLLIVFITNSINLIDGIDGLASMLSIIALLTYSVLFVAVDAYYDAAICFATMGALIPFCIHNMMGFRGGVKSRIFMGDGGSLVIGFILSALAIRLWNLDESVSGQINNDIYHILAYTMLFVPCLDVVRIVIHRYRSHKPLFMPDKNHIHHKFMALGFSPRRSMWAIVAIQIGFVVLNVTLSYLLNILFIVVVDVILWSVMHIFISKKIIKRNE